MKQLSPIGCTIAQTHLPTHMWLVPDVGEELYYQYLYTHNPSTAPCMERKSKIVKSSMTKSPSGNLLPLFMGSIFNYLQQCDWIRPMGSSHLQSTTARYGQWRRRRQIQFTGCYLHFLQGSTPWKPLDALNAPCTSRVRKCALHIKIVVRVFRFRDL